MKWVSSSIVLVLLSDQNAIFWEFQENTHSEFSIICKKEKIIATHYLEEFQYKPPPSNYRLSHPNDQTTKCV